MSEHLSEQAKQTQDNYNALDPLEQAFQERNAELEARAMHPEMSIVAEDRAEARTPSQYALGEGGKMVEIPGKMELTTAQKQEHWQLEGQAKFNAKEVRRLDGVVHDTERDPIERRVAAQQIFTLTHPRRKAERPKSTPVRL